MTTPDDDPDQGIPSEPEQDSPSADEVTSTDEEAASDESTEGPAAPDDTSAEEGSESNDETEESSGSGDATSKDDSEGASNDEDAPSDDASSEEDASSEDDLPEEEELTPEIVEDEAIRGDFMIRWAVILLALLLGIREVDQTTTLLHIKVGHAIRANSFWPPAQDELSYTATGRTWVNLSWLSDVILSLVYDAAGASGLSLLTGLLAAVTFFLLSKISREGLPTWWGSLCAALALLAAHLQFTALPEIVTLLGTVWVLRNLTQWSETGERKHIWCLIVSLAVWANLDSRAYLGAALVVVYFLGTALSRWLSGRGGGETGADESGSGESAGQAGRGPLQDLAIGAGGGLIALMVNPFGWHSLLAPFAWYGQELAVLKGYIGGNAPVQLQLYGLLHTYVWDSLNHHIVAGLTVTAAAGILFTLTWRKLDVGFVLAVVAGIVVSLFCLQVLPVVALIAAVAATLAGQDWYRENCRQEYSTERLEVLFSRAGRAVTVLALAVVAWAGISGRLVGVNAAQMGMGFSTRLQENIEGTAEDLAAAPAGEIFTMRLEHGDLLVWHDHRVFLDSRIGLYLDAKDNLVQLHDDARKALRAPPNRPDSNGQDVRLGNRDLWQQVFDRFGVSTVAPRMWGDNPDYTTWISLLDSRDWTLLHQGGTSALFLRTDRTGAVLKPGRTNLIDLPALAFRDSDNALGERSRAQSPNFTERFLSAQLPLTSNNLQKARHFNAYLNVTGRGLPAAPIELVALAQLGIRHANRALVENPSDPAPYLELARAAEYASGFETAVLGPNPRMSVGQQRYVQLIHALNQALRFDPDNIRLMAQIAARYEQAGQIDLALNMSERCVETIATLPPSETEAEFALRQQVSDEMRKLSSRHTERRKTIEEQLARMQATKPNPLQLAMLLRNEGFILRAIRVIEEDSSLDGNMQSQFILAFLYSEAGWIEEAAHLFRQLDALPGAAEQPLPWMAQAAWVHMSLGDYVQAEQLCNKRIQVISTAGDQSDQGDQVQVMPTELPRLQWTLVRCCLESGKCSDAKEHLIELRKSPLRPLAELILREIDATALTAAPDPAEPGPAEPGGEPAREQPPPEAPARRPAGSNDD